MQLVSPTPSTAPIQCTPLYKPPILSPYTPVQILPAPPQSLPLVQTSAPTHTFTHTHHTCTHNHHTPTHIHSPTHHTHTLTHTHPHTHEYTHTCTHTHTPAEQEHSPWSSAPWRSPSSPSVLTRPALACSSTPSCVQVFWQRTAEELGTKWWSSWSASTSRFSTGGE